MIFNSGNKIPQTNLINNFKQEVVFGKATSDFETGELVCVESSEKFAKLDYFQTVIPSSVNSTYGNKYYYSKTMSPNGSCIAIAELYLNEQDKGTVIISFYSIYIFDSYVPQKISEFKYEINFKGYIFEPWIKIAFNPLGTACFVLCGNNEGNTAIAYAETYGYYFSIETSEEDLMSQIFTQQFTIENDECSLNPEIVFSYDGKRLYAGGNKCYTIENNSCIPTTITFTWLSGIEYQDYIIWLQADPRGFSNVGFQQNGNEIHYLYKANSRYGDRADARSEWVPSLSINDFYFQMYKNFEYGDNYAYPIQTDSNLIAPKFYYKNQNEDRVYIARSNIIESSDLPTDLKIRAIKFSNDNSYCVIEYSDNNDQGYWFYGICKYNNTLFKYELISTLKDENNNYLLCEIVDPGHTLDFICFSGDNNTIFLLERSYNKLYTYLTEVESSFPSHVLNLSEPTNFISTVTIPSMNLFTNSVFLLTNLRAYSANSDYFETDVAFCTRTLENSTKVYSMLNNNLSKNEYLIGMVKQKTSKGQNCEVSVFAQTKFNPVSTIGKYIGTGTFGLSNLNTLVFDFQPKIVFISTSREDGANKCAVFINGVTFAYVIGGESSIEIPLMVIWKETTDSGFLYIESSNVVSWVSVTPEFQFNELNTEYRYIAFG